MELALGPVSRMRADFGRDAGSLSVDATDYASLCKQAEQEGKNVVVLVTAADCPVCHGLLREWTGM